MPLALIVSARDLTRDLGHTVLWRADVERVFVSSWDEGLTAMRSMGPHFVLADALDPTGALAFCNEVRSDPALRDTTLALLSGTAEPEHEEALWRAGANAVLACPVDPTLWDGRLQELLTVPPRRAVRSPVNLRGWARQGGEREACEGVVLNLSIRGVLLETTRPLEIGATLDLAVALPGQAALDAVGQVVREDGHADGRFRYGVRLVVLRGDGRQRLEALLGAEGKHPAARTAEQEWEAMLRDSESRKAALFDAALDAILTIDHEGRIVEANRAVEAVFGWPRTALLGRKADETVLPPALRDPESRRPIAQEAHRPDRLSRRLEIQARRMEGAPFPAELVLVASLVAERPVLTAWVRDLRERRALEEQLRHAQKMEAVGRLAGGVAHDFNNLLTVMAGYTELLVDRLEGDSRTYAEEVLASAERATALTRQLLAFSKRQVLQPRVLDLNDAIARMDKLLRRVIGEDVTLAVDCAADLGRVSADPNQLEQVLLNLAVNARDAMPDGGRLELGTTNVEVDAATAAGEANARPGPYVVTWVRDTGCGMDAATRERIFEPFFTTKKRGTGLGLSTVYGIVQQSGGFLTVDSVPGEGTTFRVFLPRVAATAEPAAARTRDRVRRGTETVLLVEDDAAVRTLAARVLIGQGYTVLEAGTLEEASALLDSHRGALDLLLSDVVLPGASGPAVAQRLSERRPGLRVLYMSGHTDEALEQYGVRGDSANFMRKPFSPESLARRVREVLDRR